MLGERRRSVFLTFTDDEALDIHEMLNDPEGPVSCPRCDGNLLLARLHRQVVEHATAVVCTGCYGRLELTGPSAAS